MHIFTIVAGARPNFMKIAPSIHAFKLQQNTGLAVNYRLIHTGQHYDEKVSGDFLISSVSPSLMVKNAKGVITDSGGMTEESSAINVPFVTLRHNTERADPVKPCLDQIMSGQWNQYRSIPLWYGKTAERIFDILTKSYS